MSVGHFHQNTPCSIDSCMRYATQSCDYPIGHTCCHRPLCNAHAVPIVQERDFCPHHQLKPEHTYQRELPL